jgi:glutamyl-tRNA synthetase
MNVRTRFAPSPTGFQHVGGMRTALYAFLFARRHHGQFVLRIEDTDKEREIEGSIGHTIESLKWLGITWDEGIDIGGPYEPYLQSNRLTLYREYAQKLISAGHAYPDPYTPQEVDAFRAEAEAQKKPFLFREHRPEIIEPWDGTKPLRFRVPTIKRYEWHDLVFGDLSAGEEALDDFILIKSDGFPTYNFCHVIDDIEMKITHVTRGQEFISSTPKFLSLYDALGATPPQFASFPPILGEGGQKKLGKRDGAKDILDYRAEGYLPEAMVNFLALLGWNPGTEEEFFGMEDLIAQFDLERVQRSGAQFNEEKLLFINQHWMRTLSDEEFIRMGELMSPYTDDAGTDPVYTPEKMKAIVPLLKERAQTFEEAREMLTGELACIFIAPTPEKAVLLAKAPQNKDPIGFTKQALEALLEPITGLSAADSVDHIKISLMPLADQNPKESGGRGAILWPLRYALSGQEKSPDPFTLIHILGSEESVLRIQNALAILGE